MKKFFGTILILLIAYSQISKAQLLEKEAVFIQQTAHLDFLAPKKCGFKVDLRQKKRIGSYNLGLQAQCTVDVTQLKDLDDTAARKVDVAICAMLIPALNTSGKDLLSSCKKKSETNGLMVFDGCGPQHKIRTELSLKTPTITVFPAQKRDEYLRNSYDMKNEKLYPKSVELKSLLYDLKITKIDYSGDFPAKVDILDGQQKFSITFSECEKNH